MSKREEIRALAENAAETYFGKALAACSPDERSHAREVAQQTWESQHGQGG